MQEMKKVNLEHAWLQIYTMTNVRLGFLISDGFLPLESLNFVDSYLD